MYIFDQKKFELRFRKLNTDSGLERWLQWHESVFKSDKMPDEYIEYMLEKHDIDVLNWKRTRNYKSKKLSFDQCEYIIDELEKKGDIRMCIICCLMFQVLRISDVLYSITKGDVYTQNGEVKSQIKIFEQKTGKSRTIYIYDRNAAEDKRGRLYFFLKKYRTQIDGVPMHSTLFFNYKGTSLGDRGVRKILSKFVGVELESKGINLIKQCSCHSFRKAGATHLVVVCGVPLAIVSALMNHSSIRTTMLYIGVDAPEEEDAAKKLLF